jgi:signal transduction histidine kinase
VRAMSSNDFGQGDLRRAIERLEALPMRPCSARQVLANFHDEEIPSAPETAKLPHSTTTDPAWALETSRPDGTPLNPLATLERHQWWPVSCSTGPVGEALTRLWRHSVAVAFAAKKLARDAGDPDPEAVGRAGLLHNLGIWTLAAVAPEAVVAWFQAPDSAARRDFEKRMLGVESANLGRVLALRWGCPPLVVDAAWLHADLEADLEGCATEPARLALIQQAYATASTTPWAPGRVIAREIGPIDPRVRILTAKVQARCVGSFVDADCSPREERLTRDNARLRLANGRLLVEQASRDSFLHAFSQAPANEGPEAWADRVALAWCGEPGISAARVDWAGLPMPITTSTDARPPSIILPLGDPAEPLATVHLWSLGDSPGSIEEPAVLKAWESWAGQVAERLKLQRLLDEVVSAHRDRVGREEPARRKLMIESLAEFAAGAGHELNNPLAVIVGRAQLLLARLGDDPDATRSLRAVITQAQRAARILRDLMYVARAPEPRPRPCQPEEVVRACLRDLQSEAETRGVRIVAESREPGLRVWTDPEPLRQLADILTRNALEATPTGGLVQFHTGGDTKALRWSIHDSGRGISATEGAHLFDPFYCGRQAGRGLGLGLPRASRIVAQAGGELKWQSIPGVGTTFLVTLPVAKIPGLPEDERPGGPKPDRALPGR